MQLNCLHWAPLHKETVCSRALRHPPRPSSGPTPSPLAGTSWANPHFATTNTPPHDAASVRIAMWCHPHGVQGISPGAGEAHRLTARQPGIVPRVTCQPVFLAPSAPAPPSTRLLPATNPSPHPSRVLMPSTYGTPVPLSLHSTSHTPTSVSSVSQLLSPSVPPVVQGA